MNEETDRRQAERRRDDGMVALAALLGVPATCPKCGSDRGWSGPHYSGSTMFVTPEEILAPPTQCVLPDGRELIARLDLLERASLIHQRLSWHCRICEFDITTPTLDQVTK